ncbi:Uma2 family endonuclease [Roseicella aquatilis]|uniref:Uma2 family endonuclease n=1 Tax=Roseicella aquatilis TaxID=2527868 RepID=A0A4V2WL32_9PROT|nr:Uma2 family endonuclease [Roseicella aquatilis]TCZ60888.1 Uma2 family endonuclease [Roseicella aquatilis]
MDQLPTRQPAEPVPKNPTREEFRAWAERQPGRYELFWGEVVPMNAERLGHVQVKAQVWLALAQAVRVAGVECQAYSDGATVEIGENTNYEPDALVNAGPRPGPNQIAAPNPVIVVEVASPSTTSIDTGEKLADYFRVPSIQHYLIVRTAKREVIHHRRDGEDIKARVIRTGPLHLDPPGLTVAVEDFFVDLPEEPR